jgi:hypothetical protein
MPVAVGSRVFLVQGLRWELCGTPDHPHWLANVCTGLSELGIDVVGGHAVREPSGSWVAHVDVDLSDCLVDGESIDVAALAAERQWPVNLDPLRLRSVDVRRRDDGSLELQLTGATERGFLGRLLRDVAHLALDPVELAGSTRTGVVQLRVVLTGAEGAAPSRAQVELLESLLLGYLVPGRR